MEEESPNVHHLNSRETVQLQSQVMAIVLFVE